MFLLSLAVLAGSASAQLSPNPLPAQAAETTRVSAPAGPVIGSLAHGLTVWEGIPYAQPPVGPLRWRAPQTLPAWTAERPALQPGVACPQGVTTPGQGQSIRGAEDCLFLNVYAPQNAKGLPVMVWIHGGSFLNGAGSDYDPRVLAREQGVVVVTLNYRLGALGFLATPALEENGSVGNYGLLDQQLALKWVRQNIAAFGGDAANVTAFGESAGGMSICQQLLMPAARGLFDKAIIQSGACTDPQVSAPRHVALARGSSAAEAIGCKVNDAACLRGLPLAKVLEAKPSGLPTTVTFPPLYGDPTLPDSPMAVYRQRQNPAAVAPMSVMIGGNTNEGTVFIARLVKQPGQDISLKEYLGANYVFNGREGLLKSLSNYPASRYSTRALAAAAAVTDNIFACPASDIGHTLAARMPVYSYEFRDAGVPIKLPTSTAIPAFGAFHSAEVASILGTSATFVSFDKFSPAQLELAKTMRTYWANFAKTGNPNGVGLPEWPRMETTGEKLLEFRPERVGVVSDFRATHKCGTVWK